MSNSQHSMNVRDLNRRWMNIHFLLNLAACTLIVILEIIVHYVIRIMGIFVIPEAEYFRLFVVSPALLIIATMLVQVLLFRSSMSDRKKYTMLTVGLLLPCAIVFIFHGYYHVLAMLFVFPVIASVNYGDIKLTRRTAIAALPVEILALRLSHLFPGRHLETVDDFLDFGLSLTIQICVMILCVVIVHNENEKFAAIEAKEQARLQAEKAARTDTLTGLSNRTALREAFDQLLKQPQNPYILAMCDLDNFKLCNDRLGHPEGDAVLKQFAHAIGKHCEMCYRYGGDEFCILFEEMDLSQATEICRRIAADFQSSVSDEVCKLKVAPSFGLAESSADLPPSVVIHHADTALYRAKKTADTFICCYDIHS